MSVYAYICVYIYVYIYVYMHTFVICYAFLLGHVFVDVSLYVVRERSLFSPWYVAKPEPWPPTVPRINYLGYWSPEGPNVWVGVVWC